MAGTVHPCGLLLQTRSSGVVGPFTRPKATDAQLCQDFFVFPTQRPRLSICPKVGQSTQLLPVLQIRSRFDLDDILHAFVELRSISRHFGPFRALFKILPVSELYFRAADLDLVHPVFLLKAILAIHVRYGDNADQNKAKKSVQGALEAKPKVEIWRRHVFLTQRPRLVLRSKVGQSTQLLPV